MSDADDQMGGTGGETVPDPAKVTPGKDNAAPADSDEAAEDAEAAEDEASESSEDSFPASDPPANY